MGSPSSRHTRHGRWRAPGTVTVAAALLVAACGDNGDSATGTDGDDELATCGSEAPLPTGAEDDGAEPDPDAVLVWGSMQAESLDPIRDGAVDYAQLNAVFDTLVTVSPEDGAIEPRLAESWEIEDDGEVLVLTLREDVVFQDGEPFDAEAVAFNLDRAREDPDSTITDRLELVEEVEVADDLTVELHLSEPTPLAMLQLLAERPGMMASPAAVEEAGSSDAFSEAPVGAGMYRVDGEWFPRESLTVEAWDDYWDPDAQLLAGVEFTEVDPDAVVNSLRSEAVDVATVEALDVGTLDDDPDVDLTVGPAALGRGLTVNPTIEPLDDPQVRQAISHAINRDAVVEALTDGHGEARCQPFAANSPAYDPELNEQNGYDPDRARELLAEAGHEDGLSFEAIIGSGSQSYIDFGELLQAQLAAVGIEMELEQVDRPRTLPMLYEEDAAPAAPIGTGANAANTDMVIRNYYLDDGSFNAGDVEVDGIRDLLTEAGASADMAAARPHYQEINRLVTTELHQNIPVYAEAAVLGHNPAVRGLTPGHIDVDPSPELLRGVYIASE